MIWCRTGGARLMPTDVEAEYCTLCGAGVKDQLESARFSTGVPKTPVATILNEILQMRQLGGAGGGGRTLTGSEPHGILSPARLPVSPLRQ